MIKETILSEDVFDDVDDIYNKISPLINNNTTIDLLNKTETIINDLIIGNLSMSKAGSAFKNKKKKKKGSKKRRSKKRRSKKRR